MNMSAFSLEGKIAWVTGGSYGIGFAIAEAFAMAGATIVFNDINQELVDKGLKAYEEAGIKNPRAEVSMFEVHDCFSVTELVTMEDLHISETGKGWKDVLDGFYDADGKIPCQIDGGLKCFGHPIGASGLRMLYGYTMAHPGKKLLFMGGEFAHFIEWKFDDQLDWFLLKYERHPEVQKCVRRLNEIYRDNPCFYEIDDSWDGFQWNQANDSDHSIVAFTRTDKKGKSILAVTNFTPTFYPEYRIGLPYGGTLTEFFNTDSAEYGGSNQFNRWPVKAEEVQMQEFSFSCNICVPPMATVYFEYDKIIPPPEKKKRTRKVAATGHAAQAPEVIEAPVEKPKRTRKKAESAADAAAPAEKPKCTRKKAEAPAEAVPAEKPKRTRKKKEEPNT